MPRVPQITRTFQTVKATVLCVDTVNETVFKQEIVLPRTYPNEKQILKEVEKILNSDSVRVSHIVSTETVETRYGMSEQDFIAHAEIIEPLKVYPKKDPDQTEMTE